MKKIPATVLIAAFLFSCNKASETYTVEERTLNEAVYASGEIWPDEFDLLRSNSPERILKITVEEGDTVKPGDVLVILGTPSENTQLVILSEQVALARQNTRESEGILTELRSKISLAKSRYRQDSINAKRYTELVKSKAVSEKEAEQAKIQAETSLMEYKNLQQSYSTRKNELYNQLLSTERELARIKQSQEGKVLTSRLNGIVYSINMEEGETAKPEEPVLLVGSTGQFKLELLVDERDINKIRLGQKVFFETDAYADKQFEAEVTKIVPVLQKENRSFKVEARVSDKEDFYPQSSVEANILIRENIKTPVIPSSYLQEGDSVTVKIDKKEHKVKVKTGTRNNDWVEVKEGLKAGDILTK